MTTDSEWASAWAEAGYIHPKTLVKGPVYLQLPLVVDFSVKSWMRRNCTAGVYWLWRTQWARGRWKGPRGSFKIKVRLKGR